MSKSASLVGLIEGKIPRIEITCYAMSSHTIDLTFYTFVEEIGFLSNDIDIKDIDVASEIIKKTSISTKEEGRDWLDAGRKGKGMYKFIGDFSTLEALIKCAKELNKKIRLKQIPSESSGNSVAVVTFEVALNHKSDYRKITKWLDSKNFVKLSSESKSGHIYSLWARPNSDASIEKEWSKKGFDRIAMSYSNLKLVDTKVFKMKYPKGAKKLQL